MSENIMLVHALAELAYSIASADGKVEKKEKEAFNKIIESEFGKNAASAKNRFAILEEDSLPNIEHSFRYSMFAIKLNKKYFDKELKEKFINVIEQIADSVDGLRNQEKHLISQFKREIELI